MALCRFDFELQSYRVTYPNQGLNIYQRYDLGKEYVVQGVDCTIRQISGKLPIPQVPKDAKYLGTSVIRGKTCDHWTYQELKGDICDFWDFPSTPMPQPMREIDKAMVFQVQIDWMEYKVCVVERGRDPTCR